MGDDVSNKINRLEDSVNKTNERVNRLERELVQGMSEQKSLLTEVVEELRKQNHDNRLCIEEVKGKTEKQEEFGKGAAWLFGITVAAAAAAAHISTVVFGA